MAKEFTFRGFREEELKQMSLKEFSTLLPSRERRSLLRGFTTDEEKLLKNLVAGEKNLKTHSRDLIIIPSMIGKNIGVHTGKEFLQLQITAEMLGHRLGEFALTRRMVKHSAPGVGATKSSAALSVR
ncbi:30S ribosomal protein S19 [Candidatus Woesearchaeota archaeon]|nr:30S ribosomal protein S19 [Candidatus Woesearchaeota archaeon]